MVSRLEAAEIANFSELYTDLLGSFFCKLAAQDGQPSEHGGVLTALAGALTHIDQAVEEGDVEQLLAGQREFIEVGLAALDNYYLTAVLKGLIPAGSRLAHLVACHPDFDPRDTLRYHQALFAAIEQRDAQRVSQMVNAFGRREGRLATDSLALKSAGRASARLSQLQGERREAV